MSEEGRSLVLKEMENAFPRAVATKELLRKLPSFKTKAALNRLLYEMLDHKDITRASESPPTWTLSKVPDSQSAVSRVQFSDRERNSFFQALSEGKVCVYRAHINVVGQDRVGKTCFVLALLNEVFKDQCSTDAVAVKIISKELANWKEFPIGKYVDKALAKGWKAATQQRNQRQGNQSLDLLTVNRSIETRQKQQASALQAQEMGGVDLDALNLNDEDLADIKKVMEDDPDLLEQREGKVFLAIIWDHAGQEPLLPSHSALIGNLSLSFPSNDDPLSDCIRGCGMYIIVFDQSKLLTENASTGQYQPDVKKPAQEYKYCFMKQSIDYLRYWLTQLQCAFPKVEMNKRYMGYSKKVRYPPVMLVGTHDADPKAKENRDQQNETLVREFTGKEYQDHLVTPGNEDMFFRVENTLSGTEGEDPAKAVRDEIEKMSEECWSGQEQPLKWFVVEKILKRLVQITGRHIIDLPFFKDLAIKLCGIANEHIDLLLKYLNNLRVVLHFPDVQSSRHTFLCEELRDKVFIDPQWLVKVISVFVTVNLDKPPRNLKSAWDRLNSTGILEWPLVEYFLEKAHIPKKFDSAVIAIMCLVDLICPVSRSVELRQGMKFYAPGLITTLYEEDQTRGPYEWEKWTAESGLPPPLILAPAQLDTFPEPLYQRLVVRMLAKYHPHYYKLYRNCSLFAIESENLELAYHNRKYVIATVASCGKLIKLSKYQEFVSLRKFLVDEINCAREPGMNGFEFELFGIAKKEKWNTEDIEGGSLDVTVPLQDMSQPSLRSVTGGIIPEEFHKIFSRWFDSSAAMSDSPSPSPKRRKTGVAETFYNSEVTSDHLNAVAKPLRTKWHEIGLNLGLTYDELEEYERMYPRSYRRCLLAVLNAWKWKEQQPTVGVFVDACIQAEVGGEAKRLLNYQDDSKERRLDLRSIFDPPETTGRKRFQGSEWHAIGSSPRFTTFEKMMEYELRHPLSYYRRLLDVLIDWMKKEEKLTDATLVNACKRCRRRRRSKENFGIQRVASF